jgi:hypothetical protein
VLDDLRDLAEQGNLDAAHVLLDRAEIAAREISINGRMASRRSVLIFRMRAGIPAN